jgi:DNA-binding response OmpR family regulator
MDAPTVLLIDGDGDSLAIYSLILQHHGIRALQAGDGETGFRMACEEQPDLIVLEPFVPVAGGVPMTELLRMDPRSARLPVLLVTAAPILLDGLVSDGERYMVKPCQPRYFLAEVQRRLGPVLTAA